MQKGDSMPAPEAVLSAPTQAAVAAIMLTSQERGGNISVEHLISQANTMERPHSQIK